MTLFARRSAVPASASYSVIDDRLTIRGEIQTDGTIRIDGRVEGPVHRADTLIVGATGIVVGDVEAREVIVGGTIQGNVNATARIEIQSSARVRGDITAGSMRLEEGACFLGHISIDAARLSTPEDGSSTPRLPEIIPARSVGAIRRG
jgi:cytoskeletal protein CcmA (bactofilin family)